MSMYECEPFDWTSIQQTNLKASYLQGHSMVQNMSAITKMKLISNLLYSLPGTHYEHTLACH